MQPRHLLRLAAVAAPLVLFPAARADETPRDAKSGAKPESRFSEKGPAQLFKELDKNGDGKLTSDEVPEDRRSFFDHLLRTGDKDKDGALTLAEFVEASKPSERRPAGAGEGPGPGDERPDPERMFRRFDRNADGKLTLEELPEPMRERLKPAFERLGKTEITREEFARISDRIRGGGPERSLEEMFKRADRNGDGKLSVDEAPPYMR